ncbi:hypothetical protein NN561_007651 [Cricetulus griseus]
MTRPQMTAPICLVENHKEQLSVNQKAIEILNEISQPVVVVAIVGLYRTGKSYLMNRLAGQNQGTGRDEVPMITPPGIDGVSAPVIAPLGAGRTEVETSVVIRFLAAVDPKKDSWIFALAMLLSSTLVYNSMITINHQNLEQLQIPQSFFPDFVWTVRDFMLELKLDGDSITEDEYLENALKLIPGLGTLVATYVDAINSGAVPCLDDAVTTLAQRENSAAIQKAVDHYSEQMAQRLRLPPDMLQELLEEWAQKEAAEKKQELLRQKQKEQQQLMEAQEKSHKENLEQLRTKLLQEREQLIEDQKKMLEKQLQDSSSPLVVLKPCGAGEIL